MGRLPAEVWALTPADTVLLVEAFNAAQKRDDVEPPSRAEYEELVRRYG